MNIADKLRKVLEIKNNIKAALEEKGIENVGENFNSYAESIANIKGGGDEPEPEIEILPDEPPVVEIPEVPEIPEIEPWVQPEDWIDLKAKIERHSYEEYPYRIALLLQYDKTDTIVLGTTGNTTCKCITVDDGDRGFEYEVDDYAITHSWDGYTGTNGYRWVIYHFDTPEANFINFPTSTVQAIFDGINASLSGRMMSGSSDYPFYNIKDTRMVSMESINGGSIDDVYFYNSVTIEYISPNIFGNNRPSNLGSMFSGCHNLEYSPILDATGVLNLSDLFYNCYKLKYVSPIINIDRATNFHRMFYNCYSLTSIPELNTTNGTSFDSMFYGCSSLITIPELNTTNGTNFYGMFQDCSSLITIPELNTTNGTNFYSMFRNCSSLVTIPELNTTNGTNFYGMFQDCSSLITIPELNTTNGTEFGSMFNGCSSLRYIHQLNFPKARSGSISSMFYGCTNLRTVIGINAPEAYNTSSLFYNCGLLRYVGKLCLGDVDLTSKLKSLPSLEYIEIDVPKGKTLTELLYGCSKLKKIILNAPLCTAATNMFGVCSSLKEIIITPETFSQCTTFNSMFIECSSLTSIPLIDTTNGTDFTKMFYRCKSLVTIPELNTTNGTNFSYMFQDCSSLTSIPLIDTTNGTNFRNMFYRCKSLVTIPELNTTNGTEFGSMFNGCSSLVTIPELNTTNGTGFFNMFYDCHSLTSIPLIDTTNGTSFSAMFQNCYSLTSIPELNTTNGTNFSYMFQNCYLLTSIPNLNFEKATNISYLCSNSRSLSSVPLIYAPSLTSGYGSSTYCFEGCGSIKKFGGFKLPNTTGVRTLFSSNAPLIRDLGAWDLSNITGSCEFPITNITDSLKIEGRVNYTISKSYYITYVNIRNLEIESIEKDQNFSYWKCLTKQSLLNILNALVQLEEGVTKTLTLHTTYHMGILSDEEKAIATNKGWTLSEFNA